jgi:hypothetical protein
MSTGAVFFAHKKLITERNSHLAGEASGSSISNGCQAKTERCRQLAGVGTGIGGTKLHASVAGSRVTAFITTAAPQEPYFTDSPRINLSSNGPCGSASGCPSICHWSILRHFSLSGQLDSALWGRLCVWFEAFTVIVCSGIFLGDQECQYGASIQLLSLYVIFVSSEKSICPGHSSYEPLTKRWGQSQECLLQTQYWPGWSLEETLL